MFFSKNKYWPFFMWLFPLLFFAFQFILRLWPGLMMGPIMEQFSIDASHFGILAAFYYYGYAGMQIPVAVLLDRFGARIIVFLFAVICGLATLLFTYTNNFYLAIFSRLLIGAGSAVGFLGVSKVISEWFAIQKYGHMIGLSFSFGLLGAIYGGKPVGLLIETYSSQNVALILSLVSLVIGCGAYFVLRAPKNAQSISAKPFKIADFKAVVASPVIWLLALSNLLMVGSLEGFADVWGVPYLITAYTFTKANAAGLISFIFIGMLLGGPLLAFCSKKMGNYTTIASAGIIMAFGFVLLLFYHNNNYWLLAMIFFSIGILCCYQVIVFAAGADLVPRENLGITIAFLNCINMLGGSFFHTTIGKIMDLYWTGAINREGIRIYDIKTFTYGLSIIPIFAIIGALIVIFIRQYVLNSDKGLLKTHNG